LSLIVSLDKIVIKELPSAPIKGGHVQIVGGQGVAAYAAEEQLSYDG
jgi:hypothetical protein